MYSFKVMSILIPDPDLRKESYPNSKSVPLRKMGFKCTHTFFRRRGIKKTKKN